ncbi:hypothetical protein J3A83DRAFT_4357531 [Scleroderma citrinum]
MAVKNGRVRETQLEGKLSQLSTVHKGTAFERRSLQLLNDHFSMLLRCVGGRSDGGIDLVGWWWIPMSVSDVVSQDGVPSASRLGSLPRRRLRVLAQCKAEKKKFGPNYVREMEGVWHTAVYPPTRVPYSRSPSQTLSPSLIPAHIYASEQRADEHHPCVALLISESPFTQGTLRRALASGVPFLLLHLPPGTPSTSPAFFPSDAAFSPTMSPAIGAVYPNPALTHLTSPLEIRWERPIREGSGRPGLWLHGQRISSWTTDQNGDVQI